MDYFKRSTEKKVISIVIIIAFALVFFIIETDPVDAKAGKTPRIYKVIDYGNSVTVKWKAKKKAVCKVYVKKGMTYKKVGTTRGRSFNFPTARGKKYRIRIVSGARVSKSVRVKTNKYAAPKLRSASVSPLTGNKKRVKIVFNSKKKNRYELYRRTGKGKWKYVKQVKGKGKTTTVYDTVTKQSVYRVRRVTASKGKRVIHRGNYDRGGIEAITAAPAIRLDVTNLQTSLKWTAQQGVTGYAVYIKVGKKGTYRRLATTRNAEYSYYYIHGLKTKKEIKATAAGASHRYFVDPDSNPFVYAVRAYKQTGSKVSWSNYLKDGEYPVIAPNVISYNENSLTWHTVPNADNYRIYTSSDGQNWKVYKTIKGKSGKSQDHSVPHARYYGVSSITHKNGVTLESGYDHSFDVSERDKYSNKSMFWIGCSTEMGSPYYNSNDILRVNSYPYRIAQMTGASFFNPSIPGSTLADRLNSDGSRNTSRMRLMPQVVEHVRNGQNTEGPHYCETSNSRSINDFDIVVIPAGGNDYSDNIPLGDADSRDTTTYRGSLNTIMDWIGEADAVREENDKPPIKVVFVEFFYSERVGGGDDYLIRRSRFDTKNKLGLTYSDYQTVMDEVYEENRLAGKQVYRIDTTHYINHDNSPYATSDNLHMTRFTYSQIGSGIAKDMLALGVFD